MITEDYVSFETAKLLKENGFDGRCYKVWEKRYGSEPTILAAPVFVEGETTVDRESVDSAAKYMVNIYSLHNRVDGYLAPTLQMAIKWLRKNHQIFIRPNTSFLYPIKWYSEIFCYGDNLQTQQDIKTDYYDSPEEACEAAIKYCLEKII